MISSEGFATTTMMLAVITLHAILCSTGGAITSMSSMTLDALVLLQRTPEWRFHVWEKGQQCDSI